MHNSHCKYSMHVYTTVRTCTCITTKLCCLQPKVCADYDFKPADKEELEMKRGDIITVIKKKDPNWWEGEIVRNNRSCRGLFPQSYVSNYTGQV